MRTWILSFTFIILLIEVTCQNVEQPRGTESNLRVNELNKNLTSLNNSLHGRQDEDDEAGGELPEIVPEILKIVGSALSGNATAVLDNSISLLPKGVSSSISGALNLLVNTINGGRSTTKKPRQKTTTTTTTEESTEKTTSTTEIEEEEEIEETTSDLHNSTIFVDPLDHKNGSLVSAENNITDIVSLIKASIDKVNQEQGKYPVKIRGNSKAPGNRILEANQIYRPPLTQHKLFLENESLRNKLVMLLQFHREQTNMSTVDSQLEAKLMEVIHGIDKGQDQLVDVPTKKPLTELDEATPSGGDVVSNATEGDRGKPLYGVDYASAFLGLNSSQASSMATGTPVTSTTEDDEDEDEDEDN